MAQADTLDDKAVRALPPPSSGNRIFYDQEVKGFGVRVTKAGAKAFILNYRAGGRERRITIGSHPDWTVKAAREHAKGLKREIDAGADPMGQRHEDRAAPTMNDLADRFDAEHVTKRRGPTQTDYRAILRLYIRPELGKVRVAELKHDQVERLHTRIAKTYPYQANRTLAVLGKMLALAIKWGMRADNPARGIEQAPEHKRERFLSPAEIARLSEAIATVPDKSSANAIRLLLLTGSRKGEMLKSRWSEFDLEAGVWVKPSAHTKTKKTHRVPLSAPARVLLSEMRAEADDGAEFVFPGERPKPGRPAQPLGDVKRTWATVARRAGLGAMVAKTDAAGKPMRDAIGAAVLVWRPDARIHDLRHSFASILASHGLSLPIIGQLLGHTQTQTTARYAHLLDDPLRAATERVGAVVSGRPAGEVVPMGRRA